MHATRAHQAPGLRSELSLEPCRHPLIWYFVLANGFSWLTLFLLAGWLDLTAQLVVLVFTIGPTAAAVAMTALVDGPSGLRDLLGRVVQWRVGLRWYAATLLGIPLVILLTTCVLPGARTSFSPAMPPVRWLVTYVIVLTGGRLGLPLTPCVHMGLADARRSA